MNNILRYCQNQSVVKYSKLVTAGNDPSISKSMKYSQYVNSSKTRYTIISPIDHAKQTNLFIEQYIASNNKNNSINIILCNFNYFFQQYELYKNVNNNIINKNTYSSLVNDLNTWFKEYENSVGATININNLDSFLHDFYTFLQQRLNFFKIDIYYDNLNLESMTTSFINGSLTAEVYYNYLNKLFINLNKDYLAALLVGMYAVMPNDKAFYLRNYANLINPYGSIWPHHNSNIAIKTNLNFKKYY